MPASCHGGCEADWSARLPRQGLCAVQQMPLSPPSTTGVLAHHEVVARTSHRTPEHANGLQGRIVGGESPRQAARGAANAVMVGSHAARRRTCRPARWPTSAAIRAGWRCSSISAAVRPTSARRSSCCCMAAARQPPRSPVTPAGRSSPISLGIPLVLPEQSGDNNRGRCFNWFRPAHVSRDLGEALSIRQMVAAAIHRFGSDPARVFVAGLSAGGAMAAALMAAYPGRVRRRRHHRRPAGRRGEQRIGGTGAHGGGRSRAFARGLGAPGASGRTGGLCRPLAARLDLAWPGRRRGGSHQCAPAGASSGRRFMGLTAAQSASNRMARVARSGVRRSAPRWNSGHCRTCRMPGRPDAVDRVARFWGLHPT